MPENKNSLFYKFEYTGVRTTVSECYRIISDIFQRVPEIIIQHIPGGTNNTNIHGRLLSSPDGTLPGPILPNGGAAYFEFKYIGPDTTIKPMQTTQHNIHSTIKKEVERIVRRYEPQNAPFGLGLGSFVPTHESNITMEYIDYYSEKKKIASNSATEGRDQVSLNLPPTRINQEHKLYGMDAAIKTIRSEFIIPRIPPFNTIPQMPTPSRNLLLYGPPGTGKTLLGHHVANMLSKLTGKEVLFFKPNISTLLSRWHGRSEQLLTALYNESRERAEAEDATAVIFLDEFETLVGSRTAGSSGSSKVQTLLQLWDTNNQDLKNVITIAATNTPWVIDDAIARRLTTKVLVDLPSREAVRQKIAQGFRTIFTKNSFEDVKRPSWDLSEWCMARQESKELNEIQRRHLETTGRTTPKGTTLFGYSLSDIDSIMQSLHADYIDTIIFRPDHLGHFPEEKKEEYRHDLMCQGNPEECDDIKSITKSELENRWNKFTCSLSPDMTEAKILGPHPDMYPNRQQDINNQSYTITEAKNCLGTYMVPRIRAYTSVIAPSMITNAIKQAFITILNNTKSSTTLEMYGRILDYKYNGSSNHRTNGEDTDAVHLPLTSVPISKNIQIFGLQYAKNILDQRFLMPYKPGIVDMKHFKPESRVLLYGTPGTGKTMFAQYIAQELKRNTGRPVMLFMPPLSSLLSKWIGRNERLLTALYTQVRERANTTNAIPVVFLDEFENLVGSRDMRSFSNAPSTVQTLLQIWDDNNPNQFSTGVITIAATNLPHSIDSAILRRFKTRILLDLPTRDNVVHVIQSRLKWWFRYEVNDSDIKQQYNNAIEKLAKSWASYCMAKDDKNNTTRDSRVTKYLRGKQRLHRDGVTEFGFTIAEIDSAIENAYNEYGHDIIRSPTKYMRILLNGSCKNDGKICNTLLFVAYPELTGTISKEQTMDCWYKLHCWEGPGGNSHYLQGGTKSTLCDGCIRNYTPRRIRVYHSKLIPTIPQICEEITKFFKDALKNTPPSTPQSMYTRVLEYGGKIDKHNITQQQQRTTFV